MHQSQSPSIIRSQAMIGAIIAQVFDLEIKRTLTLLSEIAVSENPPHEHPLIRGLGPHLSEQFGHIDRDAFLQFMARQAGLSYTLEFQPGISQPLLNLQLETLHLKKDVPVHDGPVVPLFDMSFFENMAEDVRGFVRSHVDMVCSGKVSF